jgi:hypothetical protein
MLKPSPRLEETQPVPGGSWWTGRFGLVNWWKTKRVYTYTHIVWAGARHEKQHPRGYKILDKWPNLTAHKG